MADLVRALDSVPVLGLVLVLSLAQVLCSAHVLFWVQLFYLAPLLLPSLDPWQVLEPVQVFTLKNKSVKCNVNSGFMYRLKHGAYIFT